MNPSPHHGFEAEQPTVLNDVRADQAATLIDDAQDERQKAMRALVEAEQAKIAAASISGDETRFGLLVPDAVPEAQPSVPVAVRALATADRGEPSPAHRDEALLLPSVGPAASLVRAARSRAVSHADHGEWLEADERLYGSDPIVRAVSDESLARVDVRSADVRPVIKSTVPPPGPDRSVVVQQVSPFGSDARVLSKPKPHRVPPQHETVPFGSDRDVVLDRGVTKPVRIAQPDWADHRTAADLPGHTQDSKAKVVAVQGEVRPQRYIPTVVQSKPDPESDFRPQRFGRREVLPLTSAVCAVVVAVAALVNVLI